MVSVTSATSMAMARAAAHPATLSTAVRSMMAATRCSTAMMRSRSAMLVARHHFEWYCVRAYDGNVRFRISIKVLSYRMDLSIDVILSVCLLH